MNQPLTYSGSPNLQITNKTLSNFSAYFQGDYLKFFPHIEIDRLDLQAKFRIGDMPQYGELSMSMLDASFHGNGSVHVYKKSDGKEYFKIEQAKLKIDRMKLGNIKIRPPNGRIMEVSPVLTSLLNMFDGLLYKFLYKINEEKIDEVHLDTANSFLVDVPVSYFFTE